MTRARRTLEIDRLVLDGLDLPPHRARRVHALLHEELARALSPRGALPDTSLSAGASRVSASAPLTAAAGDREMARAVARAVAETLRPNARPPPGGGSP